MKLKSMKKAIVALLFFIPLQSFAAISFHIYKTIFVTATTTSTLAVQNDPLRAYLVIQNNGITNVIVNFNTAGNGSGIVVGPGGNFELYPCISDSIYVKSVSGTNPVTILEGN